MPSSPPASGLVSLDLLDNEHKRTFKQALMNILMIDVAEFAYAQILDGLPTEQSLNDPMSTWKDTPSTNSSIRSCARVISTRLANLDPASILRPYSLTKP